MTSLTPVVAAPTNPKDFTYDAAVSGAVGTWSNFVANSDTTNCAITSCTLYGKGCVTPYATAYPTGHLSVTGTPPVNIETTRNSHDAWVEEICISCSNHIFIGREN